MAREIDSSRIVEALRAAGIADDETKRVVIDIQAGRVPVVYIERWGDTEQLITVVEALSTVEIKRG